MDCKLKEKGIFYVRYFTCITDEKHSVCGAHRAVTQDHGSIWATVQTVPCLPALRALDLTKDWETSWGSCGGSLPVGRNHRTKLGQHSCPHPLNSLEYFCDYSSHIRYFPLPDTLFFLNQCFDKGHKSHFLLAGANFMLIQRSLVSFL